MLYDDVLKDWCDYGCCLINILYRSLEYDLLGDLAKMELWDGKNAREETLALRVLSINRTIQGWIVSPESGKQG